MAGNAVLREVSLTLPMADDMELSATKTATRLAQSMEMSADKIDEVRMALVEACINAFEHSGAEDRQVYLDFVILGDEKEEPERLQITVRDRGTGFDPTQREAPSIKDRLAGNKGPRGWGLTIIEGLMDEVEVHSGTDGTTVVMSKSR